MWISLVLDHTLLTSQFWNTVSRFWCLTNTINGLSHFTTHDLTSCHFQHATLLFHYFCCSSFDLHGIDTFSFFLMRKSKPSRDQKQLKLF